MEFSISLTDQELQIALECLSKQAYCVVAPVINKINQQIADCARPTLAASPRSRPPSGSSSNKSPPQAKAPQAPVYAPAVAPPEGSG